MPFQMKITYKGDLRTEAVHISSGTTLITDAPTDNQGKGESFSPTDLVCSALASCMFTIIGITARKENIDLTGMYAEVTKTMQSSPRKIKAIDISIYFPDDLSLSEEQKRIFKQKAEACPVALSLSSDISQNLSLHF